MRKIIVEERPPAVASGAYHGMDRINPHRDAKSIKPHEGMYKERKLEPIGRRPKGGGSP